MYGNRIYVVEVASDLLAEYWTDMSEHRTLALAVEMAEAVQRRGVPEKRIRIREFEVSGVFTAAGRVKVEVAAPVAMHDGERPSAHGAEQLVAAAASPSVAVTDIEVAS